MKKIIFYIFTICSLLFGICHAQWQPDVRLTNNTATSYTSFNNAWCIASSGDIVHAVWYDNRDANDEIYYKRSTNGGISWGADTRLTINSLASYDPSVTVSGQVVHIVWADWRDGNPKIYYKRSTDGGLTLGSDTPLTSGSAVSELPSVTVTGQTVHVAWDDQRDGNPEIYCKRSTDGGTTWGSDIRLTNNVSNSTHVSVSVTAQIVNVVWEDDRDGNIEIYYKRSTDGGVTWGADVRLTNNSFASHNPSVAVSGQVVHVVWYDTRDNSDQIYYKRSSDGGINWGADTRLSTLPAASLRPSVSLAVQCVHVVWTGSPGFEESEIYYKRSIDGGINWSTDMRLTNNTGESSFPSVSISGQAVHVVWQDNRDGNFEIYYKHDPTGNPIAIVKINTEIPQEFSLSQNYPNPFNPTTKIRFAIQSNVKSETSNTKIIIFDILGREVETLVNEQLQPGIYEVDWNASELQNGVFFCRLSAGNYSETKKMLLVK